MIVRFAVALLVLAGAGSWLASPAAGQTVVGQAVDAETGTPLRGVHVRLLAGDEETVGATFSDEEGRFRLTAPRPGTWRITAELLGRATSTSAPLELETGETVTVEIRMGVDPVEIGEAVVVSAAPRRPDPDVHGFHQRRRRGERTGFGHFIHGEDLERSITARPTDILRRVAGVRLTSNTGFGQIIRMRGGCIPAIYIDGMQINHNSRGESLDSYVTVHDLDGIEVYRGMQAPAQYIDLAGCGVVLVWTKRGGEADRPFSWTRFLVGIGLVLGLILLR